jgi:hypothetical protein
MARLTVLAAGIVIAILSAACGKDELAPTPDGGATGACLDLPTDLPRPPTSGLPCELLPPGFVPAGK